MVIFFLNFNGNEALIGLFVFMPVIVLLIPTFLIIRYSKTLGDN
jgi:ABC-type glycerol-3-phosphate transport system permease component